MAPTNKPTKPLLKPYGGKSKPRTEALFGTNPPGRPVSNLGKYLLKPTPEVPEGVEMLNTSPDLIEKVQEQYLKAFQLPPALQPKYLRTPAVMDQRRAKNISKGFRNPRSLAK